VEILFCCNPEMRKLPEPNFEREFDAAQACGFASRLFGLEAFLAGKVERAFEQLPPGRGTPLLYRGWILTESEYRLLHEARAIGTTPCSPRRPRTSRRCTAEPLRPHRRPEPASRVDRGEELDRAGGRAIAGRGA
jgi:hypothetical protein